MADLLEPADPVAFLRGGGTTGALIANYDWSSTALGRLEAWPQSLKTATSMILRSPAPMVILWGPDAVMIYNDAYSAFAGDLHPSLLGSKLREVWPNDAGLLDEAIRLGLSGATLTRHDHESTHFRSGQPEQVWMDVAFSPIPGESGQPAGVLALVTDTTPRVRAERKAAAETARQRRMFEQAPGFISILQGPEHVFEFVNNTHNRLFGPGVEGKSIREAFPESTTTAEMLDRVYASGERIVIQGERVLLPADETRPIEEHYLDYVLEPITDDHGEVQGIFCEGFDVTNEVRARIAAEENQRRLSAALAIARLGAFEWDLEKRVAVMDERAREIFGFSPDQPLTFDDVLARIHPEDLVRTRTLRRETAARRQIEYRVCLPDGTSRYIVSISDAVRAKGRLERVTGVVSDITERKRAEDRQRLLINELNHRVKNTLATVQSIAAQTLRAAPGTAGARDAFEARLIALAAAHDLLTAESWHGARMADVVASAVAPFETMQPPQIERAGPTLWLTSSRALALSMALHELATNAVKYGALSRQEGRVSIRWRRIGDDEIILSWIERGGPRVEPPTRSGFGSRLLQRSLARELGGKVDFRLEPEGARCEIQFHLGAAAAAPIAKAAAAL